MAIGPSGGVDLTRAMITDPVQLADWLVIAPVALPLLFGSILLMVRHRTQLHGAIAMFGLLAVLAVDIGLLVHVMTNGPVVMTMGRWLPPFGISFVADALGAMLALTAGLIAFVSGLFALGTVGRAGRRYGFFTFLMLMLAGVGGSFLTGDIFNLYVWFEVFLISSFGLIILGSSPRQVDGATKYAILNLVATTLFLIATGYLYGIFGTLNMADIARKAEALQGTAPLMTLGVLYFVAFGMKAAAFPLNFWLPASYHTPRIVVAALFGGLLTKVGIYALLRTLTTIFPEVRTGIEDLIGWVAIGTMVIGVLGALSQSDIRRILGFLVVSGIGVMLAGLAVGDRTGLAGTIVYAVHSMIVMTALYFLAGLMRRAGGSYSLHALGGLYGTNPLLAGAALLLILGVAGLPPTSGLWPKVMLVKASLDSGAWLLAMAILFTGFVTTLALGRVFALAFWRPALRADAMNTEPLPLSAYTALGILCFLVAVLGIYPQPVIGLAETATTLLIDPTAYIDSVYPPEGQP